MMRGCLFVLAAACLAIIGCQPQASSNSQPTLRLIATTTVRDSGLLEPWVAWAEAQSGLTIEVIAVSSGQAADLTRRGEADLVMLHAPVLERDLVDEGIIAADQLLMRNDFVLVGPRDDLAGIADQTDWLVAMQRIASTESRFVSRADRSGTHQRELELWQAAGVEPGRWRMETGLGQAETLRTASELQGYALIDRATLVTHRQWIDLRDFTPQGSWSTNEYRLMLVVDRIRPSQNESAAERLFALLTSAASRDWIDSFGEERFGESLFRSLEPSRLIIP